MDISCVVLSWNSERYLEECLSKLILDLDQSRLSYEIYVVDNGSRDRSVSILEGFHRQYPDRIFPLFLDKNTGTPYSRNLALKQVRGRYVCILDCDLEVSPGAIARLTRTLEMNGRIGLAAPRLVYPDGKLQKSTDEFPTILTKARRYLHLKKIEKHHHEQERGLLRGQTEPTEVDYAISAMWVFKRTLLEKVGLMDENIFYAPEDVDYCLRVWKASFAVVYDPAVTCVHHTKEISRGTLNRATIRHIFGLCYYFWKHRYLFTRPERQE